MRSAISLMIFQLVPDESTNWKEMHIFYTIDLHRMQFDWCKMTVETE